MIAWSIMRLFGVSVKRNFRQPFGAVSIVDYWQRWHITLSVILKELFYLKLKSKFGMYGTVFIVFLCSAIWHGVSGNFIIWGLFHATLWCVSHYLNKLGLWFINYVVLFFGIIIGRVIFSEIDLSFLWDKIQCLFNVTKWSLNSEFIFPNFSRIEISSLIMGLAMIILEIILPKLGLTDKDYRHLKHPIVSAIIALYVCLVFTGWGGAAVYGNR